MKHLKTVLTVVIAVAIIGGAIGGIWYYNQQKHGPRRGPEGAFNGDYNQMCQRLSQNGGGPTDSRTVGARSGSDRDSNAPQITDEQKAQMETRQKQIEDFCADGTIDSSEQATLEEQMKEMQNTRGNGGMGMGMGGGFGQQPR